MTEPAYEAELLELPPELRGLPYEERRDAQRWAESALPYLPFTEIVGALAAQRPELVAAHEALRHLPETEALLQEVGLL